MDPIAAIEYNSIIKGLKDHIKNIHQFGYETYIPLPVTKKEQNLEEFNDSNEILNLEISNCNFCAGINSSKLIFEKLPEKVKVLFLVDMPKLPETKRVFSADERTLFSRIIKAMGLPVNELFVLPFSRCRHMPHEFDNFIAGFEQSTCRDFLMRSIALINPEKICIMGKNLPDSSIKEIYGNSVYSTFSLNDMIIEPHLKKEAWGTFQQILAG